MHLPVELLGNHGHVVLIDNESGIEAHPPNIASNMCTIGMPQSRMPTAGSAVCPRILPAPCIRQQSNTPPLRGSW
jgi:hypothetical protein